MKKQVQVHCLPTDKASNIHFVPIEDSIGINYEKGENGELIRLKEPKWLFTKFATEFGYPPYYLYITTDESPKEGDWFLWKDEGHDYPLLMQCSGFTDNTHIKVNSTNEYGYGDWSKDFVKGKVVATDNPELWKTAASDYKRDIALIGLNKISPEFQQAYVREANKGNVITDAQMEMEEMYNDIGLLQPKLNEQGYVTILPIAEKLYRREDVVTLTLKMQHDYTKYKESCHYGPNLREIADWTHQWLKQNL